MLHAIEQRSNAHKQSWEGDPCRDWRALSLPSTPRRHRESQSAAAEGKLSQRQGPKKSIVRVSNRGWDVHYEYEDQHRHSHQCRCKPCLNESGNTEPRQNKTDAHQIDPERMTGNPAANESRNICGEREMLGTEDSHRNRKKKRAEWHDLVDAMFLRHFLENSDEADNQNQRCTNVHPEYRRRHAKGRGSQSEYDAIELLETAEWDLQAGRLPYDFEVRYSKGPNQRKQPDWDGRTGFIREQSITS